MRKRMGANMLRRRAETRSPAAIKRAAKRGFSVVRVIVIAFLVCAGSVIGAHRLWVWASTSPKLQVRDIEVRGTVRTESKEIIRLSSIKEGAQMLRIKPKAAIRAIMTNCWVRCARVSLHFPRGVVISIEERVPIALVNVGGIYYADAEGALMPMFASTYSDLPLISGLTLQRPDSAGKRICQNDMKRVLAFIAQANSVDESIMKHVSQIDFSNQSMVRVTLENSRMLVEIDSRKDAVQWQRFQQLMGIFDNTAEGMPQRINLCYSNLGFAQW